MIKLVCYVLLILSIMQGAESYPKGPSTLSSIRQARLQQLLGSQFWAKYTSYHHSLQQDLNFKSQRSSATNLEEPSKRLTDLIEQNKKNTAGGIIYYPRYRRLL